MGEDRLEARIRERTGFLAQRPSRRTQRHALELGPVDQPLPQRRLPDRKSRLPRLARCGQREDVLDRVDEGIRMPRHERFGPVHGRGGRPTTTRVGTDRHVGAVLGEDPQPRAPRRRHAREHDSAPGGRDEFGIGIRNRHPVARHPQEGSPLEGAPQVVTGMPVALQRRCSRHATARSHRRSDLARGTLPALGCSSAPVRHDPSMVGHAGARRVLAARGGESPLRAPCGGASPYAPHGRRSARRRRVKHKSARLGVDLRRRGASARQRGASARQRASASSETARQKGSSGSTAMATKSSVRYVIDAWKTRMGRGSVPRTARLYSRCDS